MIADPTIFYTSYLDDYHKFKVITLKGILDNIEKYQTEFFNTELTEENKTAYKKTIQADLRQTYFHAIETFFEIFFCLNPKDKNFKGDKNIMIALTQSKWRESFDKINEIANNDTGLDFLNEEVSMNNTKVSFVCTG